MRTAAVVAGVAALFFGLGYLLAQSEADYRTRDFFCYWVGSRLVLEGTNPYREDLWRLAVGTLFSDDPGACWTHYPAPLWTAMLMAPFAALPLKVAASSWIALTLGSTLSGLMLIWRAANGAPRAALLFYLLTLFSQPFWVLLVNGQLAGVLVLAVGALAWSLARGRDGTGGLALVALAIKPHVSILFAAMILARALRDRRRRLVVAALAIGGGMFAASLAIRRSGQATGSPVSWSIGSES